VQLVVFPVRNYVNLFLFSALDTMNDLVGKVEKRASRP
jgi:hypothetical protein